MKSISEIKENLACGAVEDAQGALKELLVQMPDNLEAKLLYGTCCHLVGDDETFVRIDNEVARNSEQCHRRIFRNYHALRVAACGVALTLAGLSPMLGAQTAYGVNTLYGGGEYYCKTYTRRIYFDAGGGSGSMATVTRKTDDCSYESYTLPSCQFTRSGYSFVGWNVNNVCMIPDESEYWYPGDELDISGDCGDFYLTAVWSVASYYVTLNTLGGSGGSSYVYGTFGSYLPSISVPSKTGY